ncbi:MAG: tail fiber domain-containing protein [Rhodanobacteraceae bacterium]|nr:tail fiber domain-containing protein [Rhodanobacteraceae bacterium]MBL0040202.1 tail fiber domain-containing protein [Xanthomonadales bacterium]MBP6078836.1 tail fiber domain-containing protein [Xanthomonadales bacterium]MBP7623736.1 tail fiber domain-containing protein [Xanthomonadales bacterium]
MIPHRHCTLLAASLFTLVAAAPALAIDVSTAGQSAHHATSQAYSRAEIRVQGPNGYRFEQGVVTGNGFLLNTAGLADGEYRYSIQFSAPSLGNGAGAGAGGADSDGRRLGTAAGARAPDPVDGSFRISGGQVVLSPGTQQASRGDDGKTVAPSLRPKDQVIPDDLIVQGSACIGLDCVNNESFGFDSIRIKENSTRIKFDDTSVGTFPANDWQLTANDSSDGGLNKFSIEDITGSRVPLTVEGGATTNSIYVDSTGRIGFRTSTPALDLHVNTSNTPGIRLEQNNSGGFTAQTWDVAGNEANFFVRDVTGGSRLSFRIRPGAPTSSLDISSDGDVGVGTGSPNAKLDVASAVASADPATIQLRVSNTHSDFTTAPDRFTVDSNGNVSARGSITQLSSRDAKTDFAETDADAVLARVARLPITTWRYKDADRGDRHLGPVAQDFHAAFGLGRDDEHVAPTDLAGVALAAIQALNAQIADRDARIEALERRLTTLEQQRTER